MLALVGAGADPFIADAKGIRPKDLVAMELLQNAFAVNAAAAPSSPLNPLPHPIRLTIYRRLEPRTLFMSYGVLAKSVRAQVISDLVTHIFARSGLQG